MLEHFPLPSSFIPSLFFFSHKLPERDFLISPNSGPGNARVILDGGVVCGPFIQQDFPSTQSVRRSPDMRHDLSETKTNGVEKGTITLYSVSDLSLRAPFPLISNFQLARRPGEIL